jgi:hypothetical protein
MGTRSDNRRMAVSSNSISGFLLGEPLLELLDVPLQPGQVI